MSKSVSQCILARHGTDHTLERVKMEKDAIFSDDRLHRFVLSRVWDVNKGVICFIGLNPSIASDIVDDPTIRKWMGFAERWGYGGILIGNLFSFRATHPSDMKKVKTPTMHILNLSYLASIHRISKLTVASWGNDGAYLQQSRNVLRRLQEFQKPIRAMKINIGSGEPAHPLYLPYSLRPDYLWNGLSWENSVVSLPVEK